MNEHCAIRDTIKFCTDTIYTYLYRYHNVKLKQLKTTVQNKTQGSFCICIQCKIIYILM